MKKTLALLTITLLLAACGQKLSGTYVNPTSDAKLIFESSDKLIYDTGMGKVEVSYKIDGKNLKLISPEGTQIFTLSDDGSIQAPMGLSFKKQ
ncbi:hypothetical protein DIE14_15760 [Burkholderia sp. Bp9017]|uniref:hypothetical protein n=1 Tax=unclassified Burkholderia TaxID=2613784 RepID=UPI000F603683|nr:MULTISPECIES: hypothetical protein [unclassified Burkholderia]RQZ26112.1 hypothetical protein DIE14_15760 [Burkholderia sp. Bp9017]RQZ33993.1 hypothetical protein DIE13_15670 [Burkholderia sp. Bp9016]